MRKNLFKMVALIFSIIFFFGCGISKEDLQKEVMKEINRTYEKEAGDYGPMAIAKAVSLMDMGDGIYKGYATMTVWGEGTGNYPLTVILRDGQMMWELGG